jgi:predicted nucleic acid-binding protein
VARVPRRLVVDAAPLISLLRDEANADRVVQAIGDVGVSVSTVTLAEVADVLERVHGWPSDVVADAVSGVLGVAVEFVPPTPEIAVRAGSLRASQYRRRANDISLGDCFVLATASHGEGVVTSDRALARSARAEGIEVALVPRNGA